MSYFESLAVQGFQNNLPSRVIEQRLQTPFISWDFCDAYDRVERAGGVCFYLLDSGEEKDSWLKYSSIV